MKAKFIDEENFVRGGDFKKTLGIGKYRSQADWQKYMVNLINEECGGFWENVGLKFNEEIDGQVFYNKLLGVDISENGRHWKLIKSGIGYVTRAFKFTGKKVILTHATADFKGKGGYNFYNSLWGKVLKPNNSWSEIQHIISMTISNYMHKPGSINYES